MSSLHSTKAELFGGDPQSRVRLTHIQSVINILANFWFRPKTDQFFNSRFAAESLIAYHLLRFMTQLNQRFIAFQMTFFASEDEVCRITRGMTRR